MRPIAVLAFVWVGIACVAPTTQFSTLSPEAVRAEQLRQQQLVITSSLREQQRLLDVAVPMLRQAVPICGSKVATQTGVVVTNAHAWSRDLQPAARSLGFTDTLRVVGVVRGSAAERAGVAVGARVLSIDGRLAPIGRTAVRDFVNQVSGALAARPQRSLPEIRGPLQLGLVPEGSTESVFTTMRTVDVAVDTVCAFGALALKDDALNAYADGRQVYITTAMMRFAASDEELAVVVAHEIAHNAMGHSDAKERNSGFGALLGAVVDVAAAANGVNTGGDFTNLGAQAGATAYSQDFEREADYVGMYILARAGYPTAGAAQFWRRMAQESPGSIKYATSHPTTAERFIRLEEAAAEIEARRSAGEVLLPQAARSKP